MKMKQVMSHNINNGLLNIIRRTDPMIMKDELSVLCLRSQSRSESGSGRCRECGVCGGSGA